MRLRPVLVAAVGLGLALSPVAQGATVKKVCNLLTDPEGDQFIYRNAGTTPGSPQDAETELLSGDIASDSKTITAVIRLKKIGKTASSAPFGVGYALELLHPSAPAGPPPTSAPLSLMLRATFGSSGEKYEATFSDTPNVHEFAAAVTGTYDDKKNEIRIHAPLNTWEAATGLKLEHKKTKLTFNMYAGRTSPTMALPALGPILPPRSVFADVAEASKIYTMGAASCVTVGK